MRSSGSDYSFKILIIDDDVTSLIMLEKLLQREAYKTLVSTDGGETCMLAEQKHPDLILLDVNLPGERGPDICRRLKSNPATSEIPVLFLSVESDISSKVECFEAGGLDYITKPYEPREVLARVKTHLRLRQAQKLLVKMFSAKINDISKAQQALLPPEQMQSSDFSVHYRQLSGAGGDLYDVIKVGEDIYDYITADVSGHDLGIALVTAALKSLLVQNCTTLNTPAEIISIVNKVLPSVLCQDQFVCISWIRLNRATGKAVVLNAGQPPVIYIPVNSPVQKLEISGDIVGIFENVIFEQKTMLVEKGDRFLLYSDGLIETKGKKQNNGEETVSLLMNICEEKRTQKPSELIQTLISRLFTQQEPEDDLVVLAVEV